MRQDPLLVRSHLSILLLPSPLALLTWQVPPVIHRLRIGYFIFSDRGLYLSSHHVPTRAHVDRDWFSQGSCVIAFLSRVSGEISPPPSCSLSGTVSATEGDRSGFPTRHVRTLAVDEMMNSIRRWYPWHCATTDQFLRQVQPVTVGFLRRPRPLPRLAHGSWPL